MLARKQSGLRHSLEPVKMDSETRVVFDPNPIGPDLEALAEKNIRWVPKRSAT